MAYTVPYSSSPPSTPGSRIHGTKRNTLFANSPDELSTTPAGPPPSSALSFTPAGQPPSTIFGSSQFGTGLGKLNFGRSAQDSSKKPSSHLSATESSFKPLARTKNGTPARPTAGRGANIQFSSTSQPVAFSGTAQHLGNIQDEEAEYSDDMYDEDEPLGNSLLSDNEPGKPGFRGFTSVSPSRGPPGLQSSILSRQSQKSFGSSRGNKLRSARTSQLPSKGDDSIMSGIARDLGKRLHTAQLTEPDEVILGTEKHMSQVFNRMNDGLLENEFPRVLSSTADDLLRDWERIAESNATNSPGFHEALELASLWLKLHHPPENKQMSSALQRFDASLQNDGNLQSLHQPIPKLLLGWLDKYHTSTDETLRPIRTARPNCTAHELFWETVHALAIRGKLSDIIRLFQAADFKYAISALDDGQTEIGYHGAQLQSVQGAVNRTRQLLEVCPAVKDGNWQTDSPEWDDYREQVVSELEELIDDAEGIDPGADDVDDEVFGAPKTSSNSIRHRSRQAMSRIPWHVYESLKVLHKILLGSSTEILAIAQDWLEASFALTVWWDGVEDDKIHHWSLSVSRQSNALDEDRRESPTFSAKEGPYLRRLKASFLCATDPNLEGSFAVDTVRTSEISLTTVLQNDVEGMLRIVRSMSMVICSALAEMGVYGGWLEKSPEDKLGLDQDDLMVLGYGQTGELVSKDDILLQYVDELFSKDELRTDKDHKEGWELAISIATRMDDRPKAHDTIQNLLDQLHLTSQDRMDKLITLCNDLNLKDHAMQVSERFADHLTSNTTLYGPALLCYARAHSISKLTNLLSLVTSYSLVQSSAYPPTSSLDPALSSLLSHPRQLLSSVHETTPYGAGILQFHISGYATLRKFYDLRDADSDTARKMRPLARRRAAAKHLVAVINSAADSIHGGLYDPSRRSAIEVDGLLTLFGEATALLSSRASPNPASKKPAQPRVFTIPALYDLLAAIEDLSTVSSRVWTACEECFNATMRNYVRGSKPPSPHAMLKKSVSSGASSSNFSFSLMGSEMAGSGNTGQGGGARSVGSSGVLVRRESSEPSGGVGGEAGAGEVEVERGWDWREIVTRDIGGSGGGKGEEGMVSGREVLDRLRVGVVRELAEAELEGDAMVE
ncbi:MAG: hypothetical protein Q9160_004131 [Pyrenula sp. 1 TL-2023]